MLEHDYEPEPGLPQALPGSERMLWQGRPAFASLARRSFHVRKLALYFGALLALRLVFQLREGATVGDAVIGTAALAVLAAVAIGLVTLFAWLSARSTIFTITDRRIVIRCGVAVPVTVNLPFSKLEAADLRRHRDGSGDIAVLPEAGSQVSWVLLWPYVNPRRILRVRPVLRGVADVDRVAKLLGEAMAAGSAGRASAAGEAPPVKPATAPAAPGRDRPRWYAYPRAPLAAASALVVLALVAVAFVQLAGIEPATQPAAPVVASVDLFFDDREDGSVVVTDAASGETLDVLAPGTNGFLRSTLRSFVRTRNQVGAGDQAPFALRQNRDGRLVLADPATDREIDLWAFGETNARAFARFLNGEATAGAKPEPDAGRSAGLADDSPRAEQTAALNQQERRQ